eukprot:scaffold347_cov239-Pinguiococcus_pyrenoidosus.AAC.1
MERTQSLAQEPRMRGSLMPQEAVQLAQEIENARVWVAALRRDAETTLAQLVREEAEALREQNNPKTAPKNPKKRQRPSDKVRVEDARSFGQQQLLLLELEWEAPSALSSPTYTQSERPRAAPRPNLAMLKHLNRAPSSGRGAVLRWSFQGFQIFTPAGNFICHRRLYCWIHSLPGGLDSGAGAEA